MSFNSVKTNSSCSSRNSCKSTYNSRVQKLLTNYNNPKSNVKSLNDAITSLRSEYKNNSFFSDDIITVDYGGIKNKDDKYIYQCSLDFTKLFNIILYTKSEFGIKTMGSYLASSIKQINGISVRPRELGPKYIQGIKDKIVKQLKPESNNNNKNKNILKMHKVYFGDPEKNENNSKIKQNSNKLYMEMDIEQFYKEVLIKKKILPKIRLSKKMIIDTFKYGVDDNGPNSIKKKIKKKLSKNPGLAEYVRLETASYKLNNEKKQEIKQKIRNNTDIQSN